MPIANNYLILNKMKQTQQQKDQLLDFYNKLNVPQDQLAHEEFNFDVFHHYEKEGDRCGTCGCLLGELPHIYPELFKWEWNRVVIQLNGYPFDYTDFFGLSEKEYEHLFYPKSQDEGIDPYYNENERLEESCSKEEAMENFKRFLIIKNIL